MGKRFILFYTILMLLINTHQAHVQILITPNVCNFSEALKGAVPGKISNAVSNLVSSKDQATEIFRQANDEKTVKIVLSDDVIFKVIFILIGLLPLFIVLAVAYIIKKQNVHSRNVKT